MIERFERMKKKLFRIQWMKVLHHLLLFMFVFVINFAQINLYLLMKQKVMIEPFQVLEIITGIGYLLSILGVSIYLSYHINKGLIIHIGSSYGIFLLVSYFLMMTRNLNNENFICWKLVSNNFVQWWFLPTLGLILIISVLIVYFSRQYSFIRKIEKKLGETPSQRLLTLSLLSSFIINGSLFQEYIIEKVEEFLSKGDLLPYLFNLTVCIVIVLVAFGIFIEIILRSYRPLKENKPSFSLIVTLSSFLGLVFNYCFQYGIRSDEKILGRYIFPSATLFQIATISLFCLLVYMIVNRTLRTTTFLVFLGCSITIANSIKYSMRSEPLLFTDFSWITEIRLIASYLEVRLIVYAFLSALALAILFYFLRNRLLRGKITENLKLRGLVIVGVLSLFSAVYTIFSNETKGKIADNIPILSRLNNYENIDWMGHSVIARERSLTYIWLKQLTSHTMEQPKDYSKEKIEELVEKYTQEAQKINQTRTGDISNQTVIYVLSESFADPSRLSAVTLSDDPIPFIHSLKATTTSGLMHSDGYGGGTANMEFQTLTGLPFYNLSSSISTIYTEVVPKMTIFPSISDFFASEDKYAVHLGNAETYSRKDIYRQLGFDTFVAVTNGTENIEDYEDYQVYPSDESTYNVVLGKIDENKNQFFSVITYQNHVPWNLDNVSGIDASGEGFSVSENYYMGNYAKLLNRTDQVTAEWLASLSQLNQKITVVFYGDHLPGLYPKDVFKKSAELQYQTDYFIWSNYDTDTLSYPYVNSSDFPAELLAVTNSKVSPYYALLTDVLNQASVDKDILTKEEQEVVDDLKLIEYDMVSGKGYLSNYKNFFKVGD